MFFVCQMFIELCRPPIMNNTIYVWDSSLVRKCSIFHQETSGRHLSSRSNKMAVIPRDENETAMTGRRVACVKRLTSNKLCMTTTIRRARSSRTLVKYGQANLKTQGACRSDLRPQRLLALNDNLKRPDTSHRWQCYALRSFDLNEPDSSRNNAVWVLDFPPPPGGGIVASVRTGLRRAQRRYSINQRRNERTHCARRCAVEVRHRPLP